MAYYFSMASLKKLQGVHPDLIKLCNKALDYSVHDFIITEGLRTVEKQKALFEAKKSQTMNSRHLTGHAIDFAVIYGKEIGWALPLYKDVSEAFKKASKELNIPMIWGGDWKSLVDGPHIELDRKAYP